MKICVPSDSDAGLSAPVCSHFGRAPYFTVLDTDTDTVSTFANSGQHHGGTKTPAEVVAEHGADVILTSGLGPRAVRLFESKGIRVMIGASGTVEQAIEQYRQEKLAPATEASACKEHRH